MATSDNLLEAILETAARLPDQVFIDAAEAGIVRYGELDTLTGRLAAVLQRHGVETGDRVAMQVEKSPLNLLLFHACLRIGAACLPLNTGYTDHELAYFIGDAEPRMLVCDPSRRDGLAALDAARGLAIHTLDGKGQGSLAEALAQTDEPAPLVARKADDLAAICYTSGTTGRSKGAMLTHGNLASNAATLRELWGFSAADRLLHALPIYHVHGLFVASNTAALAGATLLFLPRFDVDTVIERLPRATSMMGVPTFYTRLLDDPRFTGELVRHMRLFISGSAPLLEETFEAFRERTGHAILERYGMTETGMNTSNPLVGERKCGTVGPALPGVSVRVRGDGGAPAARGEAGVLEVRGPNVFSGYWRMPEKTAGEFTDDGFFRTGDIARIDEDGYVSIVGRDKDMIISGGLNVYPREVEACIDAMEGIGESAVIGVPHADFGEGVVAVVTAARGHAAPDEAEVIKAARRDLAAFKIPKRVMVVESLPRNSMGKVQKNLLRETYAGLFGN
ncbi:MAG: malonyl-CoA synthase [Geminicoccaceae bacterium]|nr:malonyl-CoA synthase [Geminicoccaceae bacterium]